MTHEMSDVEQRTKAIEQNIVQCACCDIQHYISARSASNFKERTRLVQYTPSCVYTEIPSMT